MKGKYIQLRETASTNTYLSGVTSMLPDSTIVYTYNQLQGRGQRGSSWESEQGKNVTLSALFKNITIPVAKQFHISEAVSLAIVNVLSGYADGFTVKWPNDIYFHEKKICGILIEHSISGSSISHTIAGVGLNVNQAEFRSDAPNPISLLQIIGTETELDKILHEIGDAIITAVGDIEDNPEKLAELHAQYLAALYRNDNAFHQFTLPDGMSIEAKIIDVEPMGFLVLETESGEIRKFAFKEIAFA